MLSDNNPIAQMVSVSRSLCGCTQCQGGYGIGANTLSAQQIMRPCSCVAAVILGAMLTVHMEREKEAGRG